MIEAQRQAGNRQAKTCGHQIPGHLVELKGRRAVRELPCEVADDRSGSTPFDEPARDTNHPAIQKRHVGVKPAIGERSDRGFPPGKGALRQGAPGKAVELPDRTQRPLHHDVGVKPDNLGVGVKKVGQVQLCHDQRRVFGKEARHAGVVAGHPKLRRNAGPVEGPEQAARPKRPECRFLIPGQAVLEDHHIRVESRVMGQDRRQRRSGGKGVVRGDAQNDSLLRHHPPLHRPA